MNIVIVAGGLGTRFDDLSVFPKILLPTKKYNSLLEQDYKVFEGNNIFLVINEKYYNMTVNYCHVNNIDVNIVKALNTNGSYNTILSIYDNIPHNDVLFVWSDLELDSIGNLNTINEDTVITYKGNYRFGIKDGKISLYKDYNGNIPGIYYIKSLDKYFTKYKLNEKDNFDLVECLKDNSINSVEYKGIIQEYKDKKTYIDYIKNIDDNSISFKTRFFNSIVPDYTDKDNPKIKKIAIDKDYYHLIQKEYDWYKKLKNQNLQDNSYDNIVPMVYDGMINDNNPKVIISTVVVER